MRVAGVPGGTGFEDQALERHVATCVCSPRLGQPSSELRSTRKGMRALMDDDDDGGDRWDVDG